MKPNKQNFSVSLFNAFEGLYYFFKNERNGQIQLLILILTMSLGFYFCITQSEWLSVIVCFALVLSLEMINTAIEKLSDMVEPNLNPYIKIIKDVTAGAVFWASFICVIVGAVIFIPKIKQLLT